MTKYIKKYHQYINELIQTNQIDAQIQSYHRTQIAYIQHERLIHLIVTALIAILLMLSFVFLMNHFSLAATLLTLVLGVLEGFYLVHYYLLENTVQKWYQIDNYLTNKLQNIGVNHQL